MRHYTILETDSLTSLTIKVNEYLDKGWTCQGGVSVVKYFAGYHLIVEYAQAMVKEQ